MSVSNKNFPVFHHCVALVPQNKPLEIRVVQIQHFIMLNFFHCRSSTDDSSESGSQHQPPDHSFYRKLYPNIIRDIQNIEDNWRCGKHNLQRINCHSENSKGVYCLQYDDKKIVSGLRDNTIKIWDRSNLSCLKVLNGHTGSVLCLQYDENAIITGSSDSTVSF